MGVANAQVPDRVRPPKFHARVLESGGPRPQGLRVRLEHVPSDASEELLRKMHALGGPGAAPPVRPGSGMEWPELVLTGTAEQFRGLRTAPGPLSPASERCAEAIAHAIGNHSARRPRTVQGLHRRFIVGERTLVMGVVNVTPDSFSDGGRFLEPATAVSHALRLAVEGADLIDLGGESTRPGAPELSPGTEWQRIHPVLSQLHGQLTVPISVDTRHAEVAEKALDAGADLVNDVGGLRDPAMRRLLARTQAPAIAMHMRGTPATMQSDLTYDDLLTEIYDTLADAVETAVGDGVGPDGLIIDPGLGFGKSPAQNLELLDRLGEFRSMGFPILVGASRKSFLGWVLGTASSESRLEAGLAAAVVAARGGADIVRTHDVAPTVRALALHDAIARARGEPDGPGR
ncbi:MAG: dihydropteroate synthase [Thermoplasmata archaeon]|nr:dihydropteroate synthase [Thermoplasmata archaeon]